MAMTRAGIEKARKQAVVFIAHCELLLTELDENLEKQRYDSDTQKWVSVDTKPAPHDRSWGSKRSGALRRASMDLTRILADLRKP